MFAFVSGFGHYAAMANRTYSSPLRERQTEQTREHVLDTLTTLLQTGRVDEVTTRDLAREAGVAERTVYRHFPDRQALRIGLADRMERQLGDRLPTPPLDSVDDLPKAAVTLMTILDEFEVEARAEALINADPRQFSPGTAKNTEHFNELIAGAFPDLDERELVGISAVVRVLLSSQAWLRMREEFGLSGSESGPVVAWTLETIFDALRRGEHPVPTGSPTPTAKVDRRRNRRS